jgi:type II secretory pathway component PulM
MVEFMSRYSARERLIVIFAVVIMLGLGIHSFIIEPYQQKVTSLNEDLEQSKADLKWMAAMVRQLPATGSQSQNKSFDGTLANFINQTVTQQKLNSFLAQMTPKGEDEIRVRFKAVPFQDLMVFVSKVKDQGLNVRDLRVNAGDNPAQVDSSLVLDKG